MAEKKAEKTAKNSTSAKTATAPKTTTVVRLLSSGVPSSPAWVTYYLSKRRYWELELTRLKVFLEKGLDQDKPTQGY